MGRLSPRTIRALLAATCSLGVGACAADRSSPPSAQIANGRAQASGTGAAVAAATPPASPAQEGAALDRRVAAAERGVRKSEAARSRREIARVRRQLEARIARGNQATARGTTLAIAEAMGFGTPTVTVTDRARRITAALEAFGACSAPIAGPGSLADWLQKALPFVRTVELSVGGTSLEAYAAAHCAFAQLPSARTVAAATGSGTTETEPFRVGRGKWVVDYGSSGTFVQVLVLQDAELLAGSAQRSGTGTGQISFSGPGTFTLRVAGDGPWSVQVRRAGG